jgi:hypothetical protein
MAEIYQTLALENALILESREYMLRQFNFQNAGNPWTEMRMGMLYAGVSLTNDNVNSAAEDVVVSSAADRIAFGIKDSGAAIPGTTGSPSSCLFLGATTALDAVVFHVPSSYVNVEGGGQNSFGSYGVGGNLAACGAVDASYISGYNAEYLDRMLFPTVASGANNYCGFYALRFVIANQGLAAQTVTISDSTSQPVGVPYTVAALRTLINNASYQNARVIAWNNGSTAYAIPNCWFLRLPFYNNRIRISALDMIMIS